jgi:uncharacterized repeat protein (TIGR01451 family)
MFTNRWRRWLLRTVRPCRPNPVRRSSCTIRFTPRLDLLEDRVVPASYTVTTTTDFAILADNSDVNFANGQISDHGNAVSLRSAIIASNHTPGPNTITLPAGTYLITQGSADDELNHNGGVEQTGDFDVFSSSLTITGAGSATTIIDGNSIDRIFDVQSPYGTAALNGITFNLSGVTLRNGHAPADGSLNENGGAIAFNGASASGPPAGQLILNNVVLKNNTAEGAGGALYAQSVGAMTLTNVTFDSNTANHGSGGAISYQGGASDGNIQIRSGAFTNNKALDPTLGSGGAIQRSQAPGGSFVVQYSSFSGNQAGTNGGALSDENAGTTSTLRLTESTVAGNSAGGNGGGVYINDTAGGIAALLSNTVTNNRANTAGGTGVGGGIDPAASGVTLVNTIVAGNFKGASGSTADDAQGTLSANSSYNLFGTGGSANLTSGNTSHNLFNVANAGLGPLADYGGSTLTVPLLAGSPALDAGVNPDASNTDQRFNGNFVRVVDLPSVPNATDGTDIGAFESRGFSLTLVGSDSGSTMVETQFPNPLRVAVTARDTNVPVDGALVTYTGPVTTTGATIYPNPTSATVSSGIASATVFANFMSSPTSYTVLASLVGGVNTVPFHLTNTPAQPTDLAVTIVGPPTALAGTDVTYTITVKNNGPNDAQNVTLADTLPGNRMSFGSQSQTSGPAFTLSNTGNVISDTIATLTANATAIFTVTAHILASVPNNTQVSDTATVTLSNPDPNLSNNSSTTSAAISTQADLAVTQTGSATALAGTNVSYTIGVANNGPSDAQGVVIGDTLPAGETFVSLSQTAGPAFTPGVNGNTFSEFISTLASGASASFTVVAQVNANVANNTVLNNTVRASSSTNDPNSGNNTVTVSTTVGTAADLVVSNIGPATAIAGDPANVTYAITVTNTGPSDAQSVALADVLPAGMTFVSQTQTSGPGFSLTNYGNSISDTIATLPGGASEVQTITVTGTSGTITLTFNNQSTGPLPFNATFGVIQGALSSLSTIGGVGGSVNVSQSGNVYTIGFQGSMTGTAEPLLGAAGAAGASATVAEVTHGGPGAPATFNVVAHVSAGVANNTVLNNTATVSASTTDPNLANNSSTASTRINPLSNLGVTGASAHLVTGQSTVDGVILTFNESIQGGTFTTAAVDSLTGPSGAITPSGVTPLSPTQFEVTFTAETTPGTYTLVVGPYITDLAGNPMDQNGDGIGGEDPADRYTTSFDLPLLIVHNGDQGYAESGPDWQDRTTSLGYGGVLAYAQAGTGQDIASWQVTGLTPGTYEIDATWYASSNRASNAPYNVYDGNTLLTASPILVNQQVAPSGTTVNSFQFQPLGTFTTQSGTLKIVLSNDANGYVFAEAVRFAPYQATVIVDNGQAGYTESGPDWQDRTTPLGYGGNLAYAPAGTGQDTATWQVSNLPAGTYDVEVTWYAFSNRATNAPYSVYDGNTLLTASPILVNQQVAPSGITVNGFIFQSLGQFTISSGTLTVVLSNEANGFVFADALRLVQLSD